MWDATCPDTLAPSHIHLAVREAGAVAEEAEKKKHSKYSQLSVSHNFVPIAVESMSTLGQRPSHCFASLAIALFPPHLSPSPIITTCRGWPWQCSREMPWLSSGLLPRSFSNTIFLFIINCSIIYFYCSYLL